MALFYGESVIEYHTFMSISPRPSFCICPAVGAVMAKGMMHQGKAVRITEKRPFPPPLRPFPPASHSLSNREEAFGTFFLGNAKRKNRELRQVNILPQQGGNSSRKLYCYKAKTIRSQETIQSQYRIFDIKKKELSRLTL